MDGLITLVPERWHPWLVLFFVGASVGSAVLKLILGDPKPGDSTLRRCAFALARLLDLAAINSETVVAKLKRVRAELAARDQAEIAEAQRHVDRGTTLTTAIDQHNMMTLLQEAEANAMARIEAGAPLDIVEQERFRREMAIRRMTPDQRKIEKAELVAVLSKVRGTGALVLAALLSMSSQACASSQIRTHAQIADAAEEPILAAKHLIEARMATDAKALRERVSDTQAQQQEMVALQTSYAPIEGAFEALRLAYNAYVDAIQGAHATGGDVSHEAALALLSKWQAFAEAARLMGLTVPDPPEPLRELGGGS